MRVSIVITSPSGGNRLLKLIIMDGTKFLSKQHGLTNKENAQNVWPLLYKCYHEKSQSDSGDVVSGIMFSDGRRAKSRIIGGARNKLGKMVRNLLRLFIGS